jgi:hypothetical protein
MRQLILDVSDICDELDSLIDTNPTYLVSRVRRDTRRTKNKMLYRENLWLMLRRINLLIRLHLFTGLNLILPDMQSGLQCLRQNPHSLILFES